MSASARLRRFGAAAVALLVAVASWLVLVWAQPAWLQGLQERSTDGVWRLLADKADERRLILVDIDENSLREVGPWPWPRGTQARLLDRLSAGGASQQVLDIVFADSRPDDAALLRAVQEHKPVLAQVFALPNQGDRVRSGAPGGALSGLNCPQPFAAATGFLANEEAITRAAVAAGSPIGHITPRLGDDGVVRGQPALLCFGEQAYPALAIAAAMQASGETSLQVQRGEGWLDSAWRVQGSRGRLVSVPLDERGDMRVPWWRSNSSWISISASDVLAGRVPSGLLKGSWVLVGSSAFGLNDTIATPFSAGSSGVQVHAQIITAMLDGRVPYTPRAAPILQAMAVAAGLLLLGLLVRLVPLPDDPQSGAQSGRRATNEGGKSSGLGRIALGLTRVWARFVPRVALPWLPVLGLCWALVMLALHVAALAAMGWVIDWLGPAMVVIAGGVAWGMTEHAFSRLERDRLYGHLSSYLPAPVAAALAAQGPSGSIRAQSRQVSVLFADIRNFSAYCEARPPEESAAVLHAFFSVATRVVEDEGGFIEAFQGDAIMAVWQADTPNEGPKDAEPGVGSVHPQGASLAAKRALQAAIRLYAEVQGVLPDPAPAGLEPLALGIGLESGPATAGSLGVASRRTHMVMGRTVTISNRLVGMTADLGYPILVGEGMAAQTGASGLQSLGTFMLDGMRVPHHVYAYPLFAAPRLDADSPRVGLAAAYAGAPYLSPAASSPASVQASSLPADSADGAPSRYTH